MFFRRWVINTYWRGPGQIQDCQFSADYHLPMRLSRPGAAALGGNAKIAALQHFTGSSQ
jgi:hypothetical protein